MRDLERYRWTIGFAGIALLLLPLAPGIGREYFGARIWVSIGPVNFQPGEFAKILLALFFASYLVEKRELLAVSSRRLGPIPLPDPKHLGPVLLAWGASLVVMISQKDLGSSLLFFALFVALLWVATERATYLVVGVLLFAGGAVFAHSQFAHVRGPRRRSGSTRGRTRRATASRSSSRSSRSRRVASPARASTSAAPTASRWPRPTSSSPPSVRSSGWSAPPACWSPSC